MDIETLRELIAAFQQLGGEAKETFVWYLVIAHLPSFLIGVAWTAIGGTALIKALHIVRGFPPSGQLMAAADVQIMWSTKELAQACRCLREHYHETP